MLSSVIFSQIFFIYFKLASDLIESLSLPSIVLVDWQTILHRSVTLELPLLCCVAPVVSCLSHLRELKPYQISVSMRVPSDFGMVLVWSV